MPERFPGIRTIAGALAAGALTFVEWAYSKGWFGAVLLSKLGHRFPDLNRSQLDSVYRYSRRAFEAAETLLTRRPWETVSDRLIPSRAGQLPRYRYRFFATYERTDAAGDVEEVFQTVDVESDVALSHEEVIRRGNARATFRSPVPAGRRRQPRPEER